MESFLQILPNLSIGVVSLGVLGAVIYIFVRYNERRDTQQSQVQASYLEQIEGLNTAHLHQLNERENAMRKLEYDFRSTVTAQLAKSTDVMSSTSATILSATRMMDKMMGHIEATSLKKNNA